MNFYDLFFIFLGGLGLGLFLAVIWEYLEKRVALRKTRIEGEHILQEAQEKSDSYFEASGKEVKSFQERKLGFFEKDREKQTQTIKDLQSQVDKSLHKLKFKSKEKKQQLEKIQSSIQDIRKEEKSYIQEKKELRQELKKYLQSRVEKLEKKFSIDSGKLKEVLKGEIEEIWTEKVRKVLEKQEKQEGQTLEKDCYFYLNTVLNRMDRAYCPERGISPVSFKNDKQMNEVLGPDNQFLQEIEKECGVDILVNKEDRQASIFGIDPVRRELGRMTLTKLSRKYRIDKTLIQKTVRFAKKDLFSRIRRDGQHICRKLRLKNVAPPVQNMMGALRYRYSFAQNQYFHCEEVGWLCGLLNAELGLPLKPAQRVGMFHDIGKAMDHSIEGNHAVIGAEFLSKHNEPEEILHPVRAHHHDETPSNALAYLVIVADSISGSRPGARRFTEDSYNQKMASLERIIDSFDNIEDAYIMSAGREMRVIVDNNKVSDTGALELSKLIARKIEKECSYPGLIKVTVVRHSEKVAMA